MARLRRGYFNEVALVRSPASSVVFTSATRSRGIATMFVSFAEQAAIEPRKRHKSKLRSAS